MKPLQVLISLGLVLTTLTLHSQAVCPPTEVLFLLDESENALLASSTNAQTQPFDILKASIRNFLEHPLVANSPNQFLVGAISYSSDTQQIVDIPLGTSHATATSGINSIGQVNHAGSWTYVGLEAIKRPPRIPTNQLLIVVSSQGSGNPARRARASEDAQKVAKTLGWRPYVIVAQGNNPIDMEELTAVNLGQPPVVLYDENSPTQGYTQLTGAFTIVIEKILCPAPLQITTTPPPQPPPVVVNRPCPPTEVLFLLDESENALEASSTNPQQATFDLLKTAIRNFLRHPLVINSPNEFLVGAISYSSADDQVTDIPLGSSRSQAFYNIQNIGQVSHAGSWTYVGLQAINKRPRIPANQLLIVVSSQGSGNPTRRGMASEEADRVIRLLGWRPYVIVAQGNNPLDLEELTAVNGGRRPVVLYDQSINPQGYKYLTQAFNTVIEQVLCPIPPPPAPTTARPPKTGICSDCLYEAGYGFDFDPTFCDSYYMCIPGRAPIRKSCPAGTFWDGSTCNFVEKVNCAVGTCLPSTPAGTRYPSGRCCNKYFECINGALATLSCPIGQLFNMQTRGCTPATNTTSVCESQGRFICDVNTGGPGTGGPTGCAEYSPDPYGNLCRFMFLNNSIQAPPGTMWSQQACSLIFANTDQCGAREGNGGGFFGKSPADVCNAVFLANFENGRRTAYSERQQRDLQVAITLHNTRLVQNGLVFEPNANRPYGYYYFFNNRAITQNTAFRIRFRMDSANAGGRPMTLLSNNFCELCQETVSITVTSGGPVQRQVTATFVLTNGQRVSVSANIIMQNPNNQLEVTVIIGDEAVFGQVIEYAGNSAQNPLQTVNFNPAPKPKGVEVQPNRCGYMLGQGPSGSFVGVIDMFAVYEYCRDITQILRR